MRRALAAFALAALLCGSGCIILAPGLSLRSGLTEETVTRADSSFTFWKIAVIEIDGAISDRESRALIGAQANTVSEIVERLRRARKDGWVRAVILRINSPGGGATASDILWNEIRRFREESGKPVIALLMDVAASGGYYVAVATDRIIAHPTCVTGSIGVILGRFDLTQMADKLGVRADPVKSADKKDIGSAWREMTDEERAVLQAIVDGLRARFVDAVDAGRPALDRAMVERLADGRVFTADEAAREGLVDSIGYLDDAVRAARDLAGIPDARLVMYRRGMGKLGTPYATATPPILVEPKALAEAIEGAAASAFQFLWAPGARR